MPSKKFQVKKSLIMSCVNRLSPITIVKFPELFLCCAWKFQNNAVWDASLQCYIIRHLPCPQVLVCHVTAAPSRHWRPPFCLSWPHKHQNLVDWPAYSLGNSRNIVCSWLLLSWQRKKFNCPTMYVYTRANHRYLWLFIHSGLKIITMQTVGFY